MIKNENCKPQNKNWNDWSYDKLLIDNHPVFNGNNYDKKQQCK